MKTKYRNLFWGIMLILLGGFFLAVNLGWVPALSENIWAILFVAIGLVFFAGYLSSGVSNWGLLFPAAGAGAIGVPRGLAIGNTTLPRGPGPHVLRVEQSVDTRHLDRLWVRRIQDPPQDCP